MNKNAKQLLREIAKQRGMTGDDVIFDLIVQEHRRIFRAPDEYDWATLQPPQVDPLDAALTRLDRAFQGFGYRR